MAAGPDEPDINSSTAMHSENYLFKRCGALIEDCRDDVKELRAASRKALPHHREACASLVSAATRAVSYLEELYFSAGMGVATLRVLHRLATEFQTLVDSAEALMQVHAKRSGLHAFASSIFKAGGQFDGIVADLNAVGDRVR
jgi:hypothetical protein